MYAMSCVATVWFPMTRSTVEMIKDQSDMDGPLVDYKKKGNTVEYMGTEGNLIHLRVLRKALPITYAAILTGEHIGEGKANFCLS